MTCYFIESCVKLQAFVLVCLGTRDKLKKERDRLMERLATGEEKHQVLNPRHLSLNQLVIDATNL